MLLMADCAELSKLIHENIRLIALSEDVKNLDDAIVRFQETHPEFHRDAIIQSITEATTRQARQVDAVAKKVNEIVGQARVETRLKEKALTLKSYLETGTIPEKVAKAGKETTYAIDTLRDVVDDLKKQLKTSEPAQMERIQKQIDVFEELLASGEIPTKQEKIVLPSSKELDKALYRRDLLREEWRAKIYSARPVTIWGRIGDVFDLKRLFQTTGELSFALRQGGAFAGMHPIQLTEATLKSIRALIDPVYRYKVNRAIFNDDIMPLAHRVGLRLTPIGSVSSLAKQEEYLMSRWSERIPVIKEFTQAGITLLNLIRLGHFKTLYRTIGTTEQGTTLDTARFLGKAVNEFSGRPSLGAAESIAVGFNRIAYAPKWVISRFGVLYGHPVWSDIRNPKIALKARALVIGEYVRFFASLAAYYSIAILAGGEPDKDKHSNTFGQVRFGKDKYIDPTMGIGRIIALHFQLLDGVKKSDATAKEQKLTGHSKFVEIARYGRGKLGPLPGDILDFLVGETIMGEETTVTGWFKEFPPIAWGDIYDTMTADQEVDENSALSALTFFGQSLSVHDNKRRARNWRSSP
jgi:hypothetical protein